MEPVDERPCRRRRISAANRASAPGACHGVPASAACNRCRDRGRRRRRQADDRSPDLHAARQVRQRRGRDLLAEVAAIARDQRRPVGAVTGDRVAQIVIAALAPGGRDVRLQLAARRRELRLVDHAARAGQRGLRRQRRVGGQQRPDRFADLARGRRASRSTSATSAGGVAMIQLRRNRKNRASRSRASAGAAVRAQLAAPVRRSSVSAASRARARPARALSSFGSSDSAWS